MESFEPLINLLTLLATLSMLAERATNAQKLKNPDLRTKKPTPDEERVRESGIMNRALLTGIVLCILIKADIFEILSRLDAPWKTLGWVHVENAHWMRSVASETAGGALYAVAGCILTGVALGFGSKFWHDLLGSMYEIRDARRSRNLALSSLPTPKGGGPHE